MLGPMRLVEQWRQVEAGLPEGWADVRLKVVVEDATAVERAAALLGPANPGRSGNEVFFFAARNGVGVGPEAVRRLLGRIDAERIRGRLELLSAQEVERATTQRRTTLAEEWDAAVTALPPDWSDLYVEVEVDSSDHLEKAALSMSPLNPARYGGALAFRFRCARTLGYGASPEMVRRCLERLDDNDIRGGVRILRALSDSRHVATQGPVWYVEGKSV